MPTERRIVAPAKLGVIAVFAVLVALLPMSASAAVTFTRDVAPILYANCVSCHHSGEVAPFPLISFDDVHKRAGQIAVVTDSRFMPPWKPTPGFGHFDGERRLTEAQIKTLADWKAEGAPEGNPADLPPVPAFNSGWRLGPPDMVVKMSAPFTLAADGNRGNDVYRGFVIPLNLSQNKYVRAVEFHPGNKKIVHHALFFLDSTGVAARKQAASKDGQPGYASFGGPGFIPTGGLGGWAPGAMPNPLPDGWGKLLRGGSDLVIQEHLHPDGKVETEQSELGIYFTAEKPEHIVAGSAIRSMWINIPANDADYVVTASLKVPADVDLIGVTPHAHLICKDMWAEATLPDGTTRPLIWIKDWDFNWQGEYRYDKPLRLPAGTVLKMKYTYDNSDKNVRNPNSPPQRVHWGEQTTDEMAFLFLQWSPVNAADWPKLLRGRGIGRVGI